jgi:hypothetical protein
MMPDRKIVMRPDSPGGWKIAQVCLKQQHETDCKRPHLNSTRDFRTETFNEKSRLQRNWRALIVPYPKRPIGKNINTIPAVLSLFSQ